MRVFAKVVPTVSLSGLSGPVLWINGCTGQCKAATIKVLRWFVRSVRCNFYCLTYAHTRGTYINSTVRVIIYSFGILKRTGQAGQVV